jgi:hypothetical protein
MTDPQVQTPNPSPAPSGKGQRTYAVAVGDGVELFLFLTIARSPPGDVYVNILHKQQGSGWERWKPHASYHKSGQHHQKSFGHKALVSHRQQPDASFQDAENVVTMAIPVDEPRRLNNRCQTTDFDEVFEIPLSELDQNTQISVDVTEPNGKAIVTPGATIIRQHAFKDTVPWILVTVFAPER